MSTDDTGTGPGSLKVTGSPPRHSLATCRRRRRQSRLPHLVHSAHLSPSGISTLRQSCHPVRQRQSLDMRHSSQVPGCPLRAAASRRACTQCGLLFGQSARKRPRSPNSDPRVETGPHEVTRPEPCVHRVESASRPFSGLSDGPGPISPDVQWWRHGTRTVPSPDTDGQTTLRVCGELAALLRETRRQGSRAATGLADSASRVMAEMTVPATEPVYLGDFPDSAQCW
jgi:hypothetical protein